MNKTEKYEQLLPQAAALVEGEADVIARMANVAALLHREMGFWWTGFYRVVDGELVLGPFQGPVACTRIARGRGVCGTSWREERTIVVPDVELFPGTSPARPNPAARSSFLSVKTALSSPSSTSTAASSPLSTTPTAFTLSASLT